MSAESDSFSSSSPDPEPTRELLLAQALESCIRAERRVPGSADQIIARQPAWARAELRRLVALASSLDAVAANAVMSEDFRVAARTRLMRRIAPELADLPHAIGRNGHGPLTPERQRPGAPLTTHHPARRRRWRWLRRGGLGGLLAAALIGAATLTASASALPGEPLYGIKQAREELGVRFAGDQDARTLALLNQADARLEETTRLLQQGRTDEVAQTTQGFDDALERATTTYVITTADTSPTDPTTGAIESRLSQQQEQLQMLLASAPAPAQADLRDALVATERSRALVADPKPADTRASRPRPVVAAPTVAPEVEPTPLAPSQLNIAPRPTPAPVVAQVADRHDDDAARSSEDERGDDGSAPTAVAVNTAVPVVSAFGGTSQSGRRQGTRVQAVPVAPAVATVEDAGDDEGGQPQQAVQNDGGHSVNNASRQDDRVIAPAQNQDSGHDRVAEQPTSPEPAVVAQRAAPSDSSGVGGDVRGDASARSSAPANQAAAQSGQSSQGDQTVNAGSASNARASTSHDGGDTQRSATPVPATTARTQTSSSGTDDHHTDSSTSRDATARGQSGGSASSGQNTSTSHTASTSGTRSSSVSQTGSSNQSGGNSRDGGGH